ncbi:MAG: hypothetical protein ABGZ53_20845 [Fuerstiella sp.]
MGHQVSVGPLGMQQINRRRSWIHLHQDHVNAQDPAIEDEGPPLAVGVGNRRAEIDDNDKSLAGGEGRQDADVFTNSATRPLSLRDRPSCRRMPWKSTKTNDDVMTTKSDVELLADSIVPSSA